MMSRRSSNYWVKLPESKRPNSKCYIKTSSDDSQVIKLHSYVCWYSGAILVETSD